MNVIFSVFLQFMFTCLFIFQKWRFIFQKWYENRLFNEKQAIVYLTHNPLQNLLCSSGAQPDILTPRLADRLVSLLTSTSDTCPWFFDLARITLFLFLIPLQDLLKELKYSKFTDLMRLVKIGKVSACEYCCCLSPDVRFIFICQNGSKIKNF